MYEGSHVEARCRLKVHAVHDASCSMYVCMLHRRIGARRIVASAARRLPTAHPQCHALHCVLHACAARFGRSGRAAARCARAQYSGGVLFMTKGTALFDTVTISGTEAGVRASRAGCAQMGCVSADGMRDRLRRAWLRRLCAGRRRRGFHRGWHRHVQGRLDLEQYGGACAQRELRVRRPRAVVWYVARCGTADGWRGALVRRPTAACSP
jgi:hypothetical protein